MERTRKRVSPLFPPASAPNPLPGRDAIFLSLLSSHAVESAVDGVIAVGRRRPTPFEPLAKRRRKASGFERRQGGAFDGVRPCPQLPKNRN